MTVSKHEIDAMLEKASETRGISLERFHKLGATGELDDPELRDLWLIWGNRDTPASAPA